MRGRVVMVLGIVGLAGCGHVSTSSHPGLVTDDHVQLDEDTTTTIDALRNDLGAQQAGMTILSVTPPQNGSTLIEAGKIVYAPAANFNGTDEFDYSVGNGTETATAHVSMTIAPVNDPPTLASLPLVRTTRNAAVDIAVLAGATDIDGDPITIASVAGAAHGQVGESATTPGTLSYQPVAGYLGADSFTVSLTDGHVTVQAPVKVLVELPFSAPAAFATAAGPSSLRVADLNADGKADLIAGSYKGLTTSVLMSKTAIGASAVSFNNKSDFSTNKAPAAVSLGDLNGDGLADLVSANDTDNNVSFRLSATAAGGNASFGGKLSLSSGNRPSAVAVAEINGAGFGDLAFLNANDNTFSVRLNTTVAGATSLTFANRVSFATGVNPSAMVVADFNGDGRPDFAIANKNDNTVSVFLNLTAAAATAPALSTRVDFAVGTTPVAISAGDIDGDGRPDLVVANSGAASVSVLLNTMNANATVPTFRTHADTAVAPSPAGIALGDLDGDGQLDIATASLTDGTASILVNRTAGTTVAFVDHQDVVAGNGAAAVVIADFNGDGAGDLAVAASMDDKVVVILGR